MANSYQSNKDKCRQEMMPNKHLTTVQRPILQLSLQYMVLQLILKKLKLKKKFTNQKECSRLECQIMNEEARCKRHKMLIF